MASPPPATVIQMPSQSQTNGEAATAPTTIVAAPQTPKVAAGDSTAVPMPPSSSSPGGTVTDKVMSTTANLAQLLPTGTVLAYQALSPTFTNHGNCEDPANRWLTAVLVAVLAVFSLFFSFTDSIAGPDGKLYYGVATPRGFAVFNLSEEEEREWALGRRRKLRLRPIDYVHALFTVVVFLTLAFSDVGLQRCFFPDASSNTNELLKNMPLGFAFLSSFVFLLFPTKRKGIGYNDTTPLQTAS